MKKYILYILILIPLFSFSQTNGGVSFDSTRVVYLEGMNSASIKFNNFTNSRWLLRAWISEYDSSKKHTGFVITPPLYKTDTGESIQFKITKTKLKLKEDRESVFRINILAIPPKNSNGNNSVQFAINSRIKLFYRPKSLAPEQDNIKQSQSLLIEKGVDMITVFNPTPYYITMDKVKVNGKLNTSLSDFMVPPYEKLNIPYKNTKSAKSISYVTINDVGGRTPEVTKAL
ncbi:molecular chaperone [Escherichia coli]|nr:molecular chaperone [Escherichia coli]